MKIYFNSCFALLCPLILSSGCSWIASLTNKEGEKKESSAKPEGAENSSGKGEGKRSAGNETREGGGKGNRGGVGSTAGGGRGPVVVNTIVAEKKITPRTLNVIVTLVGRRQTDVYPKVSGRVSFIGPATGSAVKEGEVLFRIDRQEPGESFLTVPVASPISGWVGRWNVTLGTQVSTQNSVVLIVDDSALRSNIFLPVDEWAKIKLDTPVELEIAGKKYPAKVVTIARAAEAGSGRGSFEVEVQNQKQQLRSGMVANASIQLEPQQRMIVPASALRISEQGAFVFVVQEEKAKRLAVQYNVISNDEVEILSGIDAGAQLVVAGNNMLADGVAVRQPNPHSKEKEEN